MSAAVVFLAAAALTHGDVWLAGPTTSVPSKLSATPFLRTMTAMDLSLEAWLVSRHAHTLVRRPHRLFDTEHCTPGENTLTLGIPMITMGVLGIPAQLVAGDPILTYNFSVLALALVAAYAMYLLVAEWTGVPAAGIVAGLLYAFSPLRMANIHHPSVWDTSWTVLALFFAHRLFARGRWRDAVGLALAGALQLAASFYPLLGAVFLTPPFALWLLLRYRFEHVKAAQLGFVVLVFVLAAAFVFGPYLEAKAGADILERKVHYFAPWPAYLPGKRYFLGWLPLAFVVAGLALGRKRAIPGLAGDPRPALLIGAFIAALLAAGPLRNSLLAVAPTAIRPSPNPYLMLSSVLPGLDSVRGVNRLSADVHLVFMILAGMGAAGLVRVAGDRARWAAPALVVLAFLGVVRAPALGLERPYGWFVEDSIRPRASTIEFYETLARRGNRGWIFELPDTGRMIDQPRRVLLQAFHRRRTSACFASYLAPHAEQIQDLAGRLPDRGAVREVADMGFTTLVLHHPNRMGQRWKRRFVAGIEPGAPLRLVHQTQDMTAFEITLPRASTERVEPE